MYDDLVKANISRNDFIIIFLVLKFNRNYQKIFFVNKWPFDDSDREIRP